MIPSESSQSPPTAGARPYLGFKLAFLVPLARLRFLIILGAIALVISQWDMLTGYYDKWFHRGETATAGDVEYFCPMHPSVVRDTNKDKCPICFMPLAKRQKGEMGDDVLPAGTVARVQLSPYRVVLAGIQTTTVGYQRLDKEITTVGLVEFDERGLRTVPVRFAGWIDELFVNQTGQAVKKGDPLASVYSPDLVVTVQNLLDARKNSNADGEKAARDRLRFWGIESDQIDEIVKTGKPIERLTIRSPIEGHVIKKYVREGQRLDAGGALFDVANLSTVWVQAPLYEDDMTLLPKGSHDPKTGLPTRRLPVEATSRARSGETFNGNLSFIFPHVDPESRTLTVRFELDNPDHGLRPGVTATVRLRISGQDLPDSPPGKRMRVEEGKILAVPEASVIDTGRQHLVYRQSLPNTYDGVPVELGPKLTGPDGAVFFPVLKGLDPGDTVVTAGSFLIDAETRLNPAGGSIYIGGGGAGNASAQIRPSTPADEDAKITAALGKLSKADRALAMSQKYCPVLDGSRLGSMGVPVKFELEGQTVFVCCKACVKPARDNPAEILRKVEELKKGVSRK
jgi:membrane fusion protein, copper/silver efflux system